MDDKTISSPDMTEYKFAESDGAPIGTVTDSGSAAPSSFGEEAPVPAPSRFGLKNINLQSLRAPIAIILTIVVIYVIFSFYNAKKTHAAEQKKVQAQEVVATQQVPIVAPPIREIVQPSPTWSNDQIEQAQTVVQQKIDAAAQEMASNHDQLLGLRDAVSKAQQDISSVSQNVSQLTVAMQQLLLEIQQLNPPSKIKSKKKATKPLAIYHIRAIVPGRVWLESADGKSVTLRVGNKLEGYGTVEVISPQQGMVLMSDGSYIQYGVNDF